MRSYPKTFWVQSVRFSGFVFGDVVWEVLLKRCRDLAYGVNTAPKVWLLRYGPRMYAVCCKESRWLGKEAFSTLQAACFPEFFALQTAACLAALGGHWATAPVWDVPNLAMMAAIVLALINQFGLGPKTTQLMVSLYQQHLKDASSSAPLLSEASKEAKKKFGMVHGISMLLDLMNLGAVFAFICAVATE
ncbi:unnamed protein product [Symbiodinium sp. CCMP2592]|nr:unnamed protein product [Symbiodinium sp. CCMP2592]